MFYAELPRGSALRGSYQRRICVIAFILIVGIEMEIVTARPTQALIRQMESSTETQPLVWDVVVEIFVQAPSQSCLGVIVAAMYIDQELKKLLNLSCRLGPPVRILTAIPAATGPPWERCDVYVVLLGQGLRDVRAMVTDALSKVRGDDAWTRFVLVWTPALVDASHVRESTAAMWGSLRLNAVVVARTRAGVHVYNFDPFNSGSQRLFRFDQGAQHLKLGGCPLRVGVRNQSIYVSLTRNPVDNSWVLGGILGHILRACQRLLQFTSQPVEMAVYSVDVHRDNVTRAVLKNVSDGILDVALFPGAIAHMDQDVALPGWFNSWCYTWAVPYGTGGVPPLHFKLTGEFSPLTWGLIGTSLGLACVITSVLAQCTLKWAVEQPDATEDIRWLVASPVGPLASALLGRCHARAPPRTCTLRAFLACWLYVGLVLSTAYTSSLKTLVSSPQQRFTITTVDALANSNLPIRAYYQTIEQVRLAAEDSPAYQKILERIVPVNTAGELQHFISKPTVAIAHTREWLSKTKRDIILRHHAKEHMSEPGSIHIFSNHCLRTVMAFPFVVHRRSPLIYALQRALTLLSEAGLSPGVWTEAKELPPSLRRQFDLQFESKPLTLANLHPVFLFKAAADGVVIVVFCLEVGLGWVRRLCFSPNIEDSR